MKGKFDNISKGEWETITWLSDEEDLDSQNYQVAIKDKPNGSFQDTLISECMTGCVPQDEEKTNAEFITFAGNLAQKINLEAVEDVVEALKRVLDLADLWAPNYSDERIHETDISEFVALSEMKRKTKQALKSIEKEQH